MGISRVSTGMNRLLLGVAGAIVLALALPAFSGAATNYDLSYQNGGTLLVDRRAERLMSRMPAAPSNIAWCSLV